MQAFWQSPRIADKPGLKAVDMFRAVGDGRIKALWIMATNPVDSHAGGRRRARGARALPVRRRLRRRRATPTRPRYAHVLLPAAAWGEKDGTVTNSERRISRQRAFLPPPGEARPDWWQIAEVAQAHGLSRRLRLRSPARDLRRARALSACRERRHARFRHRRRMRAITPAAVRRAGALPVAASRRAASARETRFFADGGFFTPDRRARFVPTPYRAAGADGVGRAFPLVLNTGRMRDQWHTMTRTGKAAR